VRPSRTGELMFDWFKSRNQREVTSVPPMDDAAAHYRFGNALRDKGDLDRAVAEYREAVRLDPEHTDAHYSLGLVLYLTGAPEEAVAEYREMLRLHPPDRSARFAAHYCLAMALHETGDPDGSAAGYREALRLDPEGTRMLGKFLGIAHPLDLDYAITEFREALRLRSTSR